MASGWGCQYMGTNEEIKEWCLKLKHICNPGCKGCVLYGDVLFSMPNIDQEQSKKAKKRSDNPLER
jgi:hypothetical protein